MQSTLPPHPVPQEAQRYIDSMTPLQLQLHTLAIEKLGSSYFVEKTHGYKEFVKRTTPK